MEGRGSHYTGPEEGLGTRGLLGDTCCHRPGASSLPRLRVWLQVSEGSRSKPRVRVCGGCYLVCRRNVSPGRGSVCSEPETGSVGVVKGWRCQPLKAQGQGQRVPDRGVRPVPSPTASVSKVGDLQPPHPSWQLPPTSAGRARPRAGGNWDGVPWELGGESVGVGASGAQCGVTGKEGGEGRDEGTLARPEGPGVSLEGLGPRTWRRRPLAGPPPRR